MRNYRSLPTMTLAAGGILLSESNTPKYELTPAQIANLDALTDDESGELSMTCWKEVEYTGADARLVDYLKSIIVIIGNILRILFCRNENML